MTIAKLNEILWNTNAFIERTGNEYLIVDDTNPDDKLHQTLDETPFGTYREVPNADWNVTFAIIPVYKQSIEFPSTKSISRKERKKLYKPCIEFANTPVVQRLSKNNQNQIKDLLHIKKLLKIYWTKNNAERYIDQKIDELSVKDNSQNNKTKGD